MESSSIDPLDDLILYSRIFASSTLDLLQDSQQQNPLQNPLQLILWMIRNKRILLGVFESWKKLVDPLQKNPPQNPHLLSPTKESSSES